MNSRQNNTNGSYEEPNSYCHYGYLFNIYRGFAFNGQRRIVRYAYKWYGINSSN